MLEELLALGHGGAIGRLVLIRMTQGDQFSERLLAGTPTPRSRLW